MDILPACIYVYYFHAQGLELQNVTRGTGNKPRSSARASSVLNPSHLYRQDRYIFICLLIFNYYSHKRFYLYIDTCLLRYTKQMFLIAFMTETERLCLWICLYLYPDASWLPQSWGCCLRTVPTGTKALPV